MEWDVSQKVESKERNETKKRVWTFCNPWRCKGGHVLILFVPSEVNLSKSLLACLNNHFYKAISLGMIF